MIVLDFIKEHWELVLTSLIIPVLLWLGKRNSEFKKLVTDFQKKLPPKNKRAKELTDEEKEKRPFLPASAKHITVLDTTKHEITISPNDIDVFYNELENFNFKFVFFHKHYKSIINNLKRFNPKSENKNFDAVMVQEILDKSKISFFDVLWYKMAIKGRVLSKVYKFRMYKFNKTKNPKWLK